MSQYERHQITSAALEAGFMLSTGHGQGEHKLMPVSDVATLTRFAELLRTPPGDVEKAWKAGYDAGHREGISCGHDLAPRCKHDSDKEWPLSDYFDDMQRAQPTPEPSQSQLKRLAVQREPSQGEGDKCKHDKGTTLNFAHITCVLCGGIKTDGEWGIASRMWFKSVEEARFYEKNGRLPDALHQSEE